MLDTFHLLPLSLASLAAIFACRLSDWLPAHMAYQEKLLVAEIIETHGPEAGIKAPPPIIDKAPALWQLPSFSAFNVGSAVCSLLVVFWAFFAHSTNQQALLWALWGTGLVVLAFVDARSKLLPDVLTLPLLWLGLAIQLFPETRTVGLELSVIGAIAGYLPLWLLAQLYKLIRGRDGLGMGDLKLLAGMGAWSGAFALPQVLLLAALLAIAAFVLERLLRRSSADIYKERPFGPAIVAAYFIVMAFV